MQFCEIPFEDGLDIKNRMSNSTNHSDKTVGQLGDDDIYSPRISAFEDLLLSRNQLLVNKIEQPQLTEKSTSKALHWLVSTCWTNNLCDETLYTSIILFYCYKANCVILKAKLELILLTSIYVSSKKCQTKKFKIHDVLQLSTKKITANQLIETESDILELIDFNLQFDHTFIDFFWRKDLNEEQIDQIQFLAQLSLFQSSDILFQKDVFDDLVNLILNKKEVSNYQKIILGMAKLKQTQVLCHKYASKFDVEEFLIQISDIYQ